MLIGTRNCVACESCSACMMPNCLSTYISQARRAKQEARAAAIERGELSVEDPRDKMLREKKEKEKKEKAAARGAIPNSASL